LLLSVQSFTLINADSNQPMGPLVDGQLITLADLPTQNLNVRADTTGSVGSVVFDLNGQNRFRIENSPPFALFGDRRGDYFPWVPELITYVVTASAFTADDGGGSFINSKQISFTFVDDEPINQPPLVDAGPDQTITLPTNSVNLNGTVTDDDFPSNPVTTTWSQPSGPAPATFEDPSSVDTTVTFSVAGVYVLRLTADDGEFTSSDDMLVTVNSQPQQGVISFTLINAVTDQPVFTLSEGVSIPQPVATKVNIRADTNGAVGSVVFDYDTTRNFHTENTPPFSLFGDKNGDYKQVNLSLGTHTVTARAYNGRGGGGSLINSLTLGFQVVAEDLSSHQIHLSWTVDPATSLTVVWRTYDTSIASTVQHRRLGDATWTSTTGQLKPSGTTGTLHEATISGLLPATGYEYRVLRDGGTWSEVFTTRTAPAGGPADFDFVYFADTGLIGRTDGLAAGTQQVITDIANLDPLLALGGGDYISYNSDKRYGTLDASIDAWFKQSEPFLTRSVFMPTFGNHEVRLGESYDAWISRFALPASQTDNFRVGSFDVGEVHFVSILTDSDVATLPQSRVDWIVSDIQDAHARGQKWVIPYTHISAFSDGSSHPSNINLRNQLAPIFEQLNVAIVISAHDQNYERTFPLINADTETPVVTDQNLTGYDQADGVIWLKVGPGGKLSDQNGGGFSTFQTYPPPYWTAARDDTMHHFARFRVSANGILTTEIYATPGDGTPSVLYDSFTYSLAGANPEVFPFALPMSASGTPGAERHAGAIGHDVPSARLVRSGADEPTTGSAERVFAQYAEVRWRPDQARVAVGQSSGRASSAMEVFWRSGICPRAIDEAWATEIQDGHYGDMRWNGF
jgi:hypothetical protein